MQPVIGELEKHLTKAIKQLSMTNEALQEQVQKYRAANKVLANAIESNKLLQEYKILTTKQTADLLSSTPRQIRSWHQQGLIEGFRYHDNDRAPLHFRLYDVIKFIEKNFKPI